MPVILNPDKNLKGVLEVFKKRKGLILVSILAFVVLLAAGCGQKQNMMGQGDMVKLMNQNQDMMIGAMSSPEARKSMTSMMSSEKMRPVMIDMMKTPEMQKSMVQIMSNKDMQQSMVKIMSDPAMRQTMLDIMADPAMKDTFAAMIKDERLMPVAKEALK